MKVRSASLLLTVMLLSGVLARGQSYTASFTAASGASTSIEVNSFAYGVSNPNNAGGVTPALNTFNLVAATTAASNQFQQLLSAGAVLPSFTISTKAQSFVFHQVTVTRFSVNAQGQNVFTLHYNTVSIHTL